MGKNGPKFSHLLTVSLTVKRPFFFDDFPKLFCDFGWGELCIFTCSPLRGQHPRTYFRSPPFSEFIVFFKSECFFYLDCHHTGPAGCGNWRCEHLEEEIGGGGEVIIMIHPKLNFLLVLMCHWLGVRCEIIDYRALLALVLVVDLFRCDRVHLIWRTHAFPLFLLLLPLPHFKGVNRDTWGYHLLVFVRIALHNVQNSYHACRFWHIALHPAMYATYTNIPYSCV